MEMCLSPDALELFLSGIDHSIVKIVSDQVIEVMAEMGTITYIWVSDISKFCIDGIMTGGEYL